MSALQQALMSIYGVFLSAAAANLTVLSSGGTSYATLRTAILDSAGASFSVTSSVLSSAGTTFTVV